MQGMARHGLAYFLVILSVNRVSCGHHLMKGDLSC